MFKVNLVLVPSLLTLNKFHILLCCFHRWLWLSKCQLGTHSKAQTNQAVFFCVKYYPFLKSTGGYNKLRADFKLILPRKIWWGNWSHHLVTFFGITFSVGNFRQVHNRERWRKPFVYGWREKGLITMENVIVMHYQLY